MGLCLSLIASSKTIPTPTGLISATPFVPLLEKPSELSSDIAVLKGRPRGCPSCSGEILEICFRGSPN